jgi:hypothetical protein
VKLAHPEERNRVPCWNQVNEGSDIFMVTCNQRLTVSLDDGGDCTKQNVLDSITHERVGNTRKGDVVNEFIYYTELADRYGLNDTSFLTRVLKGYIPPPEIFNGRARWQVETLKKWEANEFRGPVLTFPEIEIIAQAVYREIKIRKEN